MRGTQGYVINQLERFGRLDLARTLEFLLNVCSLFDEVSNGKYSEALIILDSLGIIPRGENEVSTCVQRLTTMDKSLIQILDVLLLQAMECVEKFYSMTKAEFRTQPGVATDKENLLVNLRNRARAIVLLAGLSSQRLSRADTCAALSRSEMKLLT